MRFPGASTAGLVIHHDACNHDFWKTTGSLEVQTGSPVSSDLQVRCSVIDFVYQPWPDDRRSLHLKIMNLHWARHWGSTLEPWSQSSSFSAQNLDAFKSLGSDHNCDTCCFQALLQIIILWSFHLFQTLLWDSNLIRFKFLTKGVELR